MGKVTQKDVDDTVRMVRTAEDQNRRLQVRYKEVTKDLAGALKDRNESMIGLYRPQLAKVEQEVADCIQTVEGAITLVKGLQEDEDFLARRFDLVERLLGSVSKSRTLLTKQLVDCKKLAQAAVKALDELQGDEEDATSEYARLEDLTNEIEKRVDRDRANVKKLIAAADKALDDGNQAVLTDARVKLLDLELGKLLTTLKVNQPKIQAFKKKFPKSELGTDATWLDDRMTKLRDELDGWDKKITALVRAGNVSSKDEADGKPDVARAAKLLGIPAKEQPRLAKVLAGKPAQLEKALAQLAVDLDLEEQNGKKLVLKLEKARVLAG